MFKALSQPSIVLVCFVTLMIARSVYQWYAFGEEERLAQEARVTEERRAHASRLLEAELYQASMRVLIRPTHVHLSDLAQRLSEGERSIEYRLVNLYATLDNPVSTYEDRLEAWYLYAGNRYATEELCDKLRPMRPGMSEWTRVLRIDLHDPRMNKGVRDALIDMYTHGGPRVREDTLAAH